jgi:hypothetical protein
MPPFHFTTKLFREDKPNFNSSENHKEKPYFQGIAAFYY